LTFGVEIDYNLNYYFGESYIILKAKHDKGKPNEKRGRKAAGLRWKRYDSRAAMILKV
jgi:hypothetical protein